MGAGEQGQTAVAKRCRPCQSHTLAGNGVGDVDEYGAPGDKRLKHRGQKRIVGAAEDDLVGPLVQSSGDM